MVVGLGAGSPTQHHKLGTFLLKYNYFLFDRFTHSLLSFVKDNVYEINNKYINSHEKFRSLCFSIFSMGAELPDVRYVRDFEWGNLKRAATKRCAENRMTELDQVGLYT